MCSLALSTYVFPSNSREFINQQVEKHRSINLPDELALRILGFLSPEELGRASCVCREWRRLASDQYLWNALNLKTFYPGFNVIDQKVWEKHFDLNILGIDATGAPSLDARALIPIIRHLSKQVEGGAGVTLLTIPKGLTFTKLLRLAMFPKQGNAVPIQYITSKMTKELGDFQVDKTYIVAIANSVFANSRNQSVKDQEQLVTRLGYEMPNLLHVAALAVLTYISSSPEQLTRLYGDNPETITRCVEKIKNFNLAFGGFAASGFGICCSIPVDVAMGIGAQRKFEVSLVFGMPHSFLPASNASFLMLAAQQTNPS